MKPSNKNSEKITRKEALKTGGKVAALTAATMMMLLPTKLHAATSGDQIDKAPTRDWR